MRYKDKTISQDIMVEKAAVIPDKLTRVRKKIYKYKSSGVMDINDWDGNTNQEKWNNCYK